MSRAHTIGLRILKLQGGHTTPIYFAVATFVGADPSRGIRGLQDAVITEFVPRPTLQRVTTEQLTQFAQILQAGDYSLQLAGNQVSDTDLRNKNALIKVGGGNSSISDGDLYLIKHYVSHYLDQGVSYYDVFVRGIPI